MSGNPTFRSLLQRVKEVTLGAYEHRDLPFELLVKEIFPERNVARHPIFRAVLEMRNYPPKSQKLADLTWTPLEIEERTTQFDLTLSILDTGTSLQGSFAYASDLFELSTVARMSAQFRSLLESLAQQADLPIEQLRFIDLDDRALHLHWRGPQRALAEDSDIVSVLERHAHELPSAPAVCVGDRLLTYRDLNASASRLGRQLFERGARPGDRIGVYMRRGVECVVTFYAVMKIGAVYVPLDSSYPADRLNYICEDADLDCTVIESVSESVPPALHFRNCIRLDADCGLSGHPEEYFTFNRKHDPTVPAYVIYTSGSTGRPKGVLLPYFALANVINAQREIFKLSAADRVVQWASIGFDASIFEFLLALGPGACLFPGSRDELLPGPNLSTFLNKNSITVMTITPSALSALVPRTTPSLRTVIVAGEEFPADLARQWAMTCRVFNAYGPTEATIWATTHECPVETIGTRVPIGRPIDNVRAYVVDSNLRPVAVGQVGELCVGGLGVALGYINRSDLTEEHFINDPVCIGQGKVYRTGDLARWRPDGTLEFVGRRDSQVKIRGCRIELGEIESALLEYPGVRQAAVVAREVLGDKRLTAYVVADVTATVKQRFRDENRALPDLVSPGSSCVTDQRGSGFRPPLISQLREYLKGRVPEYMVPSTWMILNQLPLTPNGKLDRRALPVQQSRPEELGKYIAPRTELESVLAEIWAQVLRVDQVGVRDNFFELGGDSSNGAALATKISEQMQVDLPVAAVHHHPTIEQMATVVGQLGHSDVQSRNLEGVEFDEGTA